MVHTRGVVDKKAVFSRRPGDSGVCLVGNFFFVFYMLFELNRAIAFQLHCLQGHGGREYLHCYFDPTWWYNNMSEIYTRAAIITAVEKILNKRIIGATISWKFLQVEN